MTRDQIVDWLRDEGGEEELLLADGFEDAMLGVSYHWATHGEGMTQSSAVAYDLDKCIEILMQRDGMTYEGAMECFEFNTLGAYVGQHTPVFVKRMRE